MNFYPIWPWFVGMGLLFLLADTRVFRWADSPPSDRPRRTAALDGLRGILALAVVSHHSAIYHQYLVDGQWVQPPCSFYSLLGQCGVAMFFMVTGYLFWSRLIRDRGRPDWLQLYVGRLFRIGPLYLVMLLGLLALVFADAGFRLREPWRDLIQGLLQWLGLGLLDWPDLNGVPHTNLIVAGVTWTLFYEWLFYFSLPMTALTLRWPKRQLWATLGLCAAAVFAGMFQMADLDHVQAALILFFAAGMLTASLGHERPGQLLPDPVSSALVLGLVVAVFATCTTAYQPVVALLLGLAFACVASGSTVFGLLTCRPARRLGDVSYGIYLLQGLVLAVVFAPHAVRRAALGSPLVHWGAVFLAAILLILLATVTHVLIERPGIVAGRWVGARLRLLAGQNALLRGQAARLD